jgi:hypothetical protein
LRALSFAPFTPKENAMGNPELELQLNTLKRGIDEEWVDSQTIYLVIVGVCVMAFLLLETYLVASVLFR